MISSEVQRTLVKSPPELWAELSDPTALARHLGELGEIRIVRTEPERVVEWAAEHTTGVVSIKPSGWGTRVTLSATREQAAEPEIAGATLQEPAVERKAGEEAAEPDAAPQAQSGAQPDLAAEPQACPEPDMAAEPDAAAEPGPALSAKPRRSLFAWLFRRRSRTESETPAPTIVAAAPELTETLAVEPSPERPDAFAAVRQVLAPETFAATHPFAAQAAAGTPPARTESALEGGGEPEPQPAPQPEQPSTDIAAELMAAEDVTADEVSAAEVTAVLTAVLDRLGAAHHRPFSRG